jgi:glycerate kinase
MAYPVTKQSAFIEMAAASGLELVAPSQRNP